MSDFVRFRLFMSQLKYIFVLNVLTRLRCLILEAFVLLYICEVFISPFLRFLLDLSEVCEIFVRFFLVFF